jgi:endonuclease/exonuclease/phosphatase family metal-dependent hydrolase
VGVLLDNGTTTLVGYETIFDDDYFAFPRPPLVAQVVVEKADLELTLKVVVVHLKAKKAEYARRRAACQKLRAYMDARPQDRFVVIGDFNADPYDAELENSYVGTFLGQEPLYRIVTSVLPPESVTSLGWYHYVDGKKISGEFLDHVIVNAATLQTFSQISAMIVDKPGMSSSAYGADYSDHYPIVATLTP